MIVERSMKKAVPHSEKWLHEPKSLASLERALVWAEKHEPQDNFEEVAKRVESHF